MTKTPFTLALRPQLGERGAAALEFALIAPVFLGMLYGFFDFTKWSYVRAATSGALRNKLHGRRASADRPSTREYSKSR